MKKFYTFLSLLMLIVSIDVYAQKTWTGASSTAWNTTTNWSPSGVPTASDNVTIPSTPVNQPLINGTSTPVCNNLTVNSGAVLTISATSTTNSQLIVSGTATFNGSLSIGGYLAKTGKIIATNIVWNSTSSLTAYLGARCELSGDWQFSSGSSIDMGFCYVTFTGTASSTITNYSAGSNFSSLTINKTGGAVTYIGSSSTSTLTITGVLTLGSGSVLIGQPNITTILKGNLVSSGNIYMNYGTLSLEKSTGTQDIQINTNDYFSSVRINTGGTVTLTTSYYMQLKGSLTIQSGIFNPNGNQVALMGDWTNSVGPDAFAEGMGTVSFNGGNYHQYCSNENFYNLEINKTLGGALRMNGTTVTCSHYNWTAGSVDVLNSGTFTASDLLDDAIAGSFYCNSGCTINLSNYGGNIDLRGNLYIYGGTFNVYGGVNASWWPYLGNASLTMSSGILNFADQGILIKTDATYSFTNNITGGSIKTVGDFTNGRTDFIPTAGTVELYGAANSNLTMAAGKIFNLTINKAIANTVTLATNATLDGALTVQSGTFSSTAKVITLANTLDINSGGVFYMGLNSELQLASGKYLNVNNGGLLKTEGSGSDPVNITHSAGYYFISVKSGGTISSKYTYFQYLNYVQMQSGSILDPDNAFYRCTFTNNSAAPFGAVLSFANDQVVTIREVNFPALNSGYNVLKSNNAGHLYFKDATGAFAGATYENDPYSRIDWPITQPGLWTGLVSNNWHTADNWDDLAVPTAVSSVTIPSGVANMPVISANAFCNNLTINGTLTIGNSIVQVGGNVVIGGTLAMNNASGQLLIQGDVDWNSGSTAAITASSVIHVYGNWNFNDGAIANLAAGSVFFKGTSSKYIRSYSANCSFFILVSSKTGGASLGLSDYSTQPLTVNGLLKTDAGAIFSSYSNGFLTINGNIISNGIFQCDAGTVKLDGATQSITPNVTDYFNHLVFSQSGTVTIVNTHTNILNIKGDLHIDSGVFDASGITINISGNWDNSGGPAAFTEGGSRLVFNGGNYHQYIARDEIFNILEVDKPLGGALKVTDLNQGVIVSCNTYEWTAGALDVKDNSSFTATSLTNGITGNFYASNGGTITLGQYGSDPQLKGNLYIYGGTINIIAAIESQWPGNGNASITMTDGELNVYPCGIIILDNPPYTFTTNITGGTIRTEGSIENHRADFTPTAGTVEMYGTGNSNLLMYTGSLWGLTINKETTKTVMLGLGAVVNGPLTVESGTLQTNNATLTTGDNTAINNGGTLWMDLNSQLRIDPDKTLNVNNGGLLKVIGSEGNEAVATLNGASGYYNLNINDGGTISARRSSFYYMKSIIISETGIVDPANPFDFCKFRYGSGQANLAINNSQELTIQNAEFLLPCTGVNMSKNVNTGNIVMHDAIGDFSGELYESDPYFRIQWIYSQPGLWTGAVSTDWWNSANWDDGNVPNAVTDVTIPATAPFMPTIGAGVASSKNVTINGTLTIGAADLNVAQNIAINGNLTMNVAGGELIVQGDIDWNSGSTASITADAQIHAYGNWNFNAGANANLANGTVFFLGTVNKWIRSYSANCSFFNLRSQKEGGAQIGFSDLSSHDLKINGFMEVYTGAKFVSDVELNIIIKGNLTSNGIFQCNFGIVKLDGITQSITPNVNDYFNTLTFSQTGTACILNTHTNILNVKGDLHIDSGIFNAGSSTINIAGDWDNNIGPNAFGEGGSRVVFNGGNYHQYCITDENFNIVEINKPLGGAFRLAYGAEVLCNTYDWTAGAIDVLDNSSFTAPSLTNGITGNFYATDGGTITLGQYGSDPQLKGNLYINGGTINIIAAIESQWPGNGNASITMSGGELNVYPYGIVILDNPPYTFTTNITGGTIRTQGSIENHRADFNPTAGSVEMYGPGNSNLLMYTGSLWGLTINKETLQSVFLNLGAVVNGPLTIDSGTLQTNNASLTTGDNININDGGTLWMDLNSELKIASAKILNINSGGLLKTEGDEDNIVNITHSAGYYFISVKSGGVISSKYTYFQYLNYIQLQSGSILDPENAFYRCTFTINSAAPSGAVLSFHNDQVVYIHEASFPALNSGYNVLKSNDAGHVYFKDATGANAGAAYENDPYNRIDWSTSQPGLWTGAISEDWFTAGNWDDGNVPYDNVTIPATALHMLVIDNISYCNNFTLDGTVTIGNGFLFVSGDAIINGNLVMNGFIGTFSVEGDIDWNAGSTADIMPYLGEIKVYGNWNFNTGANVNLENGYVYFLGSTNKWIRSYSADCSFNHLISQKTGSAAIGVSDLSTEDLTINGYLSIDTNAAFISDSQHDIIFKGDIFSNGTFQCNSGAVKLDGVDQSIMPNVNDYFNHLVFSQTGTANIVSTNTNILNVKGDLHIDSGIFNAVNSIIKVGHNWDNNVGTAAFIEDGSRVVFNGGNTNQYCVNETFNIIEVDKPLGGALRISNSAVGTTVVCNEYDWTAGALDATNGSFTATILSDNGIAGDFYVTEGGTITLGNGSGNTDLKGNLHFNGGTINIFSGIESQWPGNGNASITMNGGELNIYPFGMVIVDNPPYTFTTNITDGSIRTQGLIINNRNDFNLTNGTFELYGAGNASIQMNVGSLNNLTINKPIGTSVNLSTNVTVNSNLTVQGGTLNSNGKNIYVGGNWNNLVGPNAFVEGSGKVIFNGDGIFQYCSTEEFNILEVDRPSGWSLWNLPDASISCQQYDWTQGGISLYEANGHFYAADLVDDGIQGYFSIGDNCSIELHQDESHSVNLLGDLHITGGEFKVYGGNGQSYWGENDNANLDMSGGVLDFVDQAISIYDNSPYQFTSSINDGTIRSQKGFMAQSPGFNPTGGTIELYGDQNALVVSENGGEFYNLTISKPGLPTNTTLLTSSIKNALLIDGGTTIVQFGQTVSCGGIIIENGGDLRLGSATIKMKDNATFNVNNGGYLYFDGYEGGLSKLTGINLTDHYNFQVNSGGWMSVNNTIFENMGGQGIYILPGATLDGVQTFNNCEFRNGLSGAYPLLSINNDQNIVIDNAVFPTNTWGGQYNVNKSNEAGSVSFIGATGDFSGEVFENDPYDRIHWTELTNYLDVKVWLEGPFNGTDMNNYLTGLPTFPLTQPYNVSPWNYAGTENVTSIPADVADWILVELRDATSASTATPGTRIGRMAAFLKKDGSIVGTDGTSNLQFSNSINQQLFVVIWHRNHLGIMSAVSLVKIGDTYSYDFTTGTTQAYGDSDGYKQWEAGVAMMVAGDGYADGNITTPDKYYSWRPNAGKKGYFSGDFNMDSQVNNSDKNEYWDPNNDYGYSSQVPE